MSGAQLLKVLPVDDRHAKQADRELNRATFRGYKTVRRPTSGLTLREDTFATLRVVAGSGKNQHIIDAGSRTKKEGSEDPYTMTLPDGRTVRATDIYSNFLLQNIVDDRQEKQQILETFGEPYIFLFGERPRIMGFQGILLNSWDFNWEAEWWANYEHYLRGTKCVENDARVYLAFDNTLVGGYILSSNVQKVATERNWLQFQFQLFVTYYETFSNLGDATVVQGDGKMVFDQSDIDQALAMSSPTNTFDLESRVAYQVDATGHVTLGSRQEAMQALRSQPSSLVAAWKKLQSATRMVLSNAHQVWDGEVVRVPQGFEGAFAYGEDVQVAKVTGEQNQRIEYSTFDKNDDEYVGESSHYGSSERAFGGWEYFETADPVVRAHANSLTVEAQAREAWIRHGMNPDASVAQALGKLVKMGRTALVGLNMARGIAALPKKRDAVKDFSGGNYDWSDVYGTLRTRANDYPYTE